MTLLLEDSSADAWIAVSLAVTGRVPSPGFSVLGGSE